MLTQIVRPLVDTQIRRLASSQTTRLTLIETIARWLSYLGVEAQVTYLTHQSGKIQVSLTVNKPDLCHPEDWEQILYNLDRSKSLYPLNSYDRLMPAQRRKLQRLFAYLIQISQPGKSISNLSGLLEDLDLDDFMLIGIKSALKVPQSVNRLLKEIEPETIALALPQAIEIALVDCQLNPEAEATISTMLRAIKSSSLENEFRFDRDIAA